MEIDPDFPNRIKARFDSRLRGAHNRAAYDQNIQSFKTNILRWPKPIYQ